MTATAVKCNYLNQKEAARCLRASGQWLCEQKAFALYAPAFYLGRNPRYHLEQIRLWQAVMAGNQTYEDAEMEWLMIKNLIGRKA